MSQLIVQCAAMAFFKSSLKNATMEVPTMETAARPLVNSRMDSGAKFQWEDEPFVATERAAIEYEFPVKIAIPVRAASAAIRSAALY